MTIFTPDSSWQDWVSFCRQQDSTRPDFEADESKCDLTTWSRAQGGISMSEAVTVMSSSDDGYRVALWVAIHTIACFPDALRDKLFSIVIADPPRAAFVFEKAHRDLTERERRRLWDSFAPTMPVATSRLGRILGEPKDA